MPPSRPANFYEYYEGGEFSSLTIARPRHTAHFARRFIHLSRWRVGRFTN